MENKLNIETILKEKGIAVTFEEWDYNAYDARFSQAHNGSEWMVVNVDVWGNLKINDKAYNIQYQNGFFDGTYNISNELSIYRDGSENKEAIIDLFEIIKGKKFEYNLDDAEEDLFLDIQEYIAEIIIECMPELNVNEEDKDFEINVYSLYDNKKRVLEHTFYGDFDIEDEKEL